MKYEILSQKHRCYDQEDIFRKTLLYKGSDDIIRNAERFIPKNLGEHPDSYKQRLAQASYVNYFASIIDYFAANLFSKEIAVIPATDDDKPEADVSSSDDDFYRAFSKDVDLRGSSLANALKVVFRQAMITGDGFLGLDFPKVDKIPESLEEEEALGASRAYCYEIDESSVINWSEDSKGNLEWVVLHKEEPVQKSPFEPQDTRIISFKVWTMEGGFAKWSLFELEVKDGKPIKGDEDIPLVGQGTTSFRRIPVLRLKMPSGLWIGNKIGCLVADHFRMRSSLFHAQNRSLYAMPYYKQGAEIDGTGALSVINEDVNRGQSASRTFANRGFAVLGPNDEVGFAEPKGDSYELINTELKEHVDEIFRIVGQMAQSISTTKGGQARSAASKLADNRAMEMLLSEYGSIMRLFAVEIFETISEARSEKIDWQAQGLSNYEFVDKVELIAEATAFSEGLIDVPSITFKKLYAAKVAQAFSPNIAPDVMIVIEQEISDFYDKHEEQILKLSEPQDPMEAHPLPPNAPPKGKEEAPKKQGSK